MSSLLLITGTMFLQNVNPADVGTRGLTVEELAKCRLMVEWARISEEVKTRLARVQVCQANVNV